MTCQFIYVVQQCFCSSYLPDLFFSVLLGWYLGCRLWQRLFGHSQKDRREEHAASSCGCLSEPEGRVSTGAWADQACVMNRDVARISSLCHSLQPKYRIHQKRCQRNRLTYVRSSFIIKYAPKMWRAIEYVIKFPCNRGSSGALNLQSAIAGVIVFLRDVHCRAALSKWRWCLGLAQQDSSNRVRSETKQH